MADDATKIKKCGISVYRSDLFCGDYYLFPKEHDLIPIKSCCKDISNHLKSINVAGGSYRHFSSSQHMSEGQLILYRAGIFYESLYKDLLVCPSHRYKLGIYFKQTRTCIYPLHTGNGKVFRGVTVAESISVLQSLGTLLPVGTGICRNCCKKVSSLKNDDLGKTIISKLKQKRTNSAIECCLSFRHNHHQKNKIPFIQINILQTNCNHQLELSKSKNELWCSGRVAVTVTYKPEYKAIDVDLGIDKLVRNTCNSVLEKADILDSSATCSQPSICSPSVTDSDAFSQASSQGSSWSVDNKESEVGLKNINAALSLLSNGSLSPLKYQVNKDIDQLHPSSKRMLKRKATSAIEELLNCFAPGQSSELKKLIELKADDEKNCQNPNVTSTIIKLYRNSSDSRIKRQMLSLIVKDFTKQKLQEMIPDLTVYSIDQARLHASVHGEGCVVPKPEKHHRQRLDQEKLAHALDFFFNPLFHQVCSYGTKEMKLDNGEHVEIPEVVRILCHANLVNAYQAFCKDLDFTPLSRSSLFEILRICPASKRTNLKGLDNIAADGATAFNTLAQVFKQLKPFIVDPDLKDDLLKTETDLQAFNLYIKTDLKMHITLDDPCPDHCIMFSLSDPSDASLQKQCNHEHDMVCDRCDMFKNSLINLKKCISELKDVPMELQSEFLNDIEVAESNILSWKQHLSRCINQDRCRQQLLENLEEEEVLIIMDWAMKFLPMVFREKQSDWFGQKGLNWHISVCIFKDGESNLMHRTYAHIFDQVKQDWFAVVSILENTLCTLKSQLPTIKRAFIRSDNAGCYHCGNTLLSLPGIAARTGIQIKRYDFSEAQDGKSYCDAKIAHLRSKIRQYVASGNNVKSGVDMKHAIDHLGGVMGCQAAYVEIDPESYKEASKTKTIWKGITKISNLEFRGNQIISWKAFGIGNGSILSEDDVRKMHRFPISSTNLVVVSDFTLPTMANGKIKLKHDNEDTEGNNQRSEDGPPQDLESSSCFTCIEPGCSRVFQTYLGFESHILLGKHNTVLNKSSTYDSVKIRWKETCLNITESLLLRREAKVTPGTSTTVMGWALKKDRKAQRFTENVKTYLRGVFHVGEQSGRKANPDDVSRNMRVCRDENGQKMFSPEEYLQPSQISSFFSRMCVMARNSKQQTIDDEDLAPALTWIDTMEAMDIINS